MLEKFKEVILPSYHIKYIGKNKEINCFDYSSHVEDRTNCASLQIEQEIPTAVTINFCYIYDTLTVIILTPSKTKLHKRILCVCVFSRYICLCNNISCDCILRFVSV